MPLPQEVQDLLELVHSPGVPPLAAQSLAEIRANYALLATQPGPEVASVEDRTVEGGPTGPFTVRIYRPLDGSTDTPDAPGVLVWIHGGGCVIGDLDTTDSTCRALANAAGIVVVSVDYHLAPEHPYPAAVDDVFTALQWVADNAGNLAIDSTKLAVGGASAGGTLTAVTTQLARAAGGPAIAFQLLIYPVVDLAGDYESHHTNGEGYLLTTETMGWFRRQYLSGRDPATPRVSPLLASDFSRLPPAMVLTAGYDPLRDEGIAYADALEGAGIPVERVHFENQIHEFFELDFLADCAIARQQAADAIRRAFDAR